MDGRSEGARQNACDQSARDFMPLAGPFIASCQFLLGLAAPSTSVLTALGLGARQNAQRDKWPPAGPVIVAVSQCLSNAQH